MKEPEWDLTCEYLEALRVFKEGGFNSALKLLVQNVSVEWAAEEILPCARIIHYPHRNSVRAQVNPALTYVTDYRVERLEILTYIMVESLAHLTKMQAPEVSACCVKLGCANTRSLTLRERWRRIGAELDPRLGGEKATGNSRAFSLIAMMYEDRPPCGWCKFPLVTGSLSDTRKDLHVGCHKYILEVVRPQLVEERRQRQAREAAAMDK